MGYLLGEMTWDECGETLKTVDFVVLPTGAMEQHSIHLPLLVDSIRAENLCSRLAEKAKEHGLHIVVLPTLYYGFSEHHFPFTGTISLKPDTYERVLEDIGWSLQQHGVKRFLIMNFHGGNIEPIRVAILRMQRDLKLKIHFIHWTSYASDLIDEYAKLKRGDQWDKPKWGHACEHETSMTLLFRPDLVKIDKIQKPNMKPTPQTRGFMRMEEMTDTGGTGDPRISSVDFARELVEKVTLRIIETLKADLKLEQE